MDQLNLNRGRKKLPNKIKFSIWYFLLALLIVSLVQDYLTAKKMENIPYSQFKQYLHEGKIANLTLAEDVIRGNLRGEDKKEFITIRVADPNLVSELDAKKISYSGSYDGKFIATLVSWLLPIGFFMAIWWFAFRRMNPGASVMSFGKSKAKIIAQDSVKVNFNDVAGVDEAKEELEEIIEFLTHPGKYAHIGGRIPRGVLLVGAPGTGKTLLARAVAGEAKVPFFSMSGSAFVEMFVGVGAARVRDLFEQAISHAPCIVFIDELDALGKARVFGPMGGAEEREQTLNQLLIEMDGFDPNVGVIVMAATNRPETLDPALLRPGRFDRHILVDRPDIKGREAILKVHARLVKLSRNVDLSVIAARTPGFVGADLANIINEAALLAVRKNKEEVEMPDLEEAIDRGMAGLAKKSRVITQKEKEIVAYHEAGHAIVASSIPLADQVHKISIIHRGIAALGYTVQLPTEDRYLMTKTELLGKLAVLLGGRMAEEIFFGEASTGGQNDLQRATEIAKSMVKEYGMSEKLGNITFESETKSPFVQVMPRPASRDYSEETARWIDEEIQRIISEISHRAREIIQGKQDRLKNLASLLLEKEVLEGEELKQALGA